MVVYSMHPTVLRENSSVVSADFPGAAWRAPAADRAAGCPRPSPPGRPAIRARSCHVLRGSSIAEVERLGGLLGEAIARVIPAIVRRSDLALQVGQCFMELPRRVMPTVAQAEADLTVAAARLAKLRGNGASPQEVRRAEVDWFGAEETVTLARVCGRWPARSRRGGLHAGRNPDPPGWTVDVRRLAGGNLRGARACAEGASF